MALSVSGLDLLLDGQPTKLWGVRVANALEDDDHVERLIGALDEYQAHGFNALTWFLQGGSSGTVDAFRADGSLDEAVLARQRRLLDETARRGMVAVVGYFYQRRPLRPRTAADVERAVRNATVWLRPWDHVVVNVANEYHARQWAESRDVYPFGDPAAINRLIDVAKEADASRLVGANAKGADLVLPVARHADLALHDDPGIAEELLFTHAVGKPVVDVECGGFALDVGHPGVFTRDAGFFFQNQVRSAQAIRAKHIFFHAHWLQEPPRRFQLGGYGTAGDPGIHWYFDLVAQVTGRTPCRATRFGFGGMPGSDAGPMGADGA